MKKNNELYKLHNQLKKNFSKIGLVGTTMSEMDAVLDVEDIRDDSAYYEKFFKKIENEIKKFGTVVSGRIVGDELEAEKISDLFYREQVDLIIAVPVNYTLDSVIIKLLRNQKVPIIIWNTSPMEKLPDNMDYDTAIANAIIACVPTLTNVLIKNDIKFKIVSGSISDKKVLNYINEYIIAAQAVKTLKTAKVGFVGNSYPGITSISVDEARVIGKFGTTIVRIENMNIEKYYKNVEIGKTKTDLDIFKKEFSFNQLTNDEIERSIKLYNAILDISKENSLDAIAQLCSYAIISDIIGIAPCFAYSILSSMGIVTTCEGDVGTAIALIILREISGDAFFAEYYLQDFVKDFILIAHCGLGNINFADTKKEIKVLPQPCFPGKHGRGAAFEFNLKSGEMTMVSLSMLTPEKWTMIACEVESIKSEAYPMICPQAKIRFKNGDLNEKFVEFCTKGGTHHLAFTFGNHLSKLEKVCDILDINFQKI